MIDDMMDRYANDYHDAIEANNTLAKKEEKEEEDELRATAISGRDIDLPSIKDSKLWQIKVTPGRERELVFKITNKLIEYLNSGNPLNVLDVFQSQVCPGVIFCEAYKSQHVEKVIDGLSGVRRVKETVKMIPINEMTEVMKTCKIVEKQRLRRHQWVRINCGIHKDDLGLVELADGNRKALVRLLPRIPESFYTDKEKTLASLRVFAKKQSQYIRVAQNLFNPQRVSEECQRELYRPLGKYFYFWRRMMFRNGFLYQEFAASKLTTENVCPNLQEVRMFQQEQSGLGMSDLLEDDYDEWDRLDDETLQTITKDGGRLSVHLHDRVRVTSGQFKNVVGRIRSIQDDLLTVTSEEKKPIEISVRAHQVCKQFRIGEEVSIVQGRRAGESGKVTQLLEGKLKHIHTHAVLLVGDSGGDRTALTVNVANLSLKEVEATKEHSNEQYFKQVLDRVAYYPGELILFDNYRKLGLVLEVNPDSLRVLDQYNRCVHVRTVEISKKVVVRDARNANCVDSENNVLTRMTYVKVRDRASPMYGKMGEIRHLFKNMLFLWMKNPLLTHSLGYFCATTTQVINAGA